MSRTCLLAVLPALAAGGCGGGSNADRGDAAIPPPRVELSGARAQAPPPPTAGTLSRIADGPHARRRLAYVNLERLAATGVPVSRARLLDRVLGPGADAVRSRRAGAAAVRVGKDATVVYDGDRPVVVAGAGAALAAVLADTRPDTSAITPSATSAVQSCLGDTIAQTILGPRTMGDDAALGVGLAESGDAPAGLQLRLCGAPRLIRHLHRMERALEARFGSLPSQIGEREIGEREIVFGTVAAGALARARLLGLLAGGRDLRSLAWR